ncbi:hypothetical protein [Rhizobium leguminosarum]|uniref:hypothetical protein n=1 Tax=Rhizobium leguminosarum TaxID=384 RepID=UPI00144286F2|nr:hypothetical protein [Rhizobium leguminosarum]NKL10370.1 hypothetical protein [Rhizobium leguminosarum bv. viciae]NKL88430.1 hypothetical protein [Rhizobium leguminosarum bv. viciae]NKL95424.1 hypothetical protein [Rhizobium leguminosarum bv. viciae]NKM96501.1 hypothetical protein [Rhizobium leguminosarum bv. viciae]
MNEADAKINSQISELTTIIGFIFSTIILLPISVIVSGKFISSRMNSNFFSEGDQFSINLVILRIKSTGDQVAWGFGMFIMTLLPVLILGGKDAYILFQSRSGIDIGQWPSLCTISGFLTVLISFIIWIIAPLFKSAPILDKKERDEQINKLLHREEPIDKNESIDKKNEPNDDK